MSGSGLGRVETPERAEHVEQSSSRPRMAWRVFPRSIEFHRPRKHDSHLCTTYLSFHTDAMGDAARTLHRSADC